MVSRGTVARASEREQRRRARLAGECRRYRVTNKAIADAAAVDPSMVSHWFAARFDSERVQTAVLRLLDEARVA